MNFKRTIRTLGISLLLACSGQTASAQDLLARQAPVDRKMRAVDTIALKRIVEKENSMTVAAALYDNWDNKYAHKATKLPEHLRIDLRNFCMPTVSRVITSNFGPRWGRQHKGLDIKVYIGDTIRSAFSGKVRIVRYEPKGYGKYVVIRHPNGLETIYGHMSKHLVKENQVIRAGEPIGLGGNTGKSNGSHLHFETRLCGVAINPALLFDFKNQDVTGDFYDFNSSDYIDEGRKANELRAQKQDRYTREQVQGKSIAQTTESEEDKVTEALKVESKSKNTAKSHTAKAYHKVKKGENLSSIARQHGITITKLCELNGFNSKKKLMPGDKLRYS